MYNRLRELVPAARGCQEAKFAQPYVLIRVIASVILVVESTVVESVGKALASVEEALISVKQTFGPSGGGGGGHVDKTANATVVAAAVPPTPPPVRSVRVKTESSLASVNITGTNGQHSLKDLKLSSSSLKFLQNPTCVN